MLIIVVAGAGAVLLLCLVLAVRKCWREQTTMQFGVRSCCPGVDTACSPCLPRSPGAFYTILFKRHREFISKMFYVTSLRASEVLQQ